MQRIKLLLKYFVHFPIYLILILGSICSTALANQDNENIIYFQHQAIKKDLASDPGWLSLLHYRKNSFTKSYFSDVDGKQFFNAKNGHRNPQTELLATIAALYSDSSEQDEEHPQCLFPARLSWLQKNLDEFNTELPKIKCTNFLKWRHSLNTDSISIIFLNPYINSISNSDSYFGNIFFKLNPPRILKNGIHRNNVEAPAKTLSYEIGSSAEQQSEWFYSTKSTFGQYPGQITFETYTSRFSRYLNSSERDAWEYKLVLTPLEIEFLLAHSWELMHSKINYFDLDENASYLLLSLIDAVRPNLKLIESLAIQVLPVDAIRLLIKKELISDIKYLPSELTNLNYHFQNLSATQKQITLDLINGNITNSSAEFQKLATTVQLYLTETALQYLHYSYDHGNFDKRNYSVRTSQLTKARKKLNPIIKTEIAPPPRSRPDQGLNTSHISLGIGKNEAENFVEINWRPALHDLLDSDASYGNTSQVNYLDTSIRVDEQNGLVQIEKLHFINLYSLKPVNALVNPWSFKFKIGFDRESVFTKAKNLYFNINTGAGFSYQLFRPVIVYGLIDSTLIIDKRFNNTLSIAAGPNLGILWQINADWKLWFNGGTQFYDAQNNNNIIENVSLNQSYALYKNKVLRLSFINQGIRKQTRNEAKMSFTWYY